MLASPAIWRHDVTETDNVRTYTTHLPESQISCNQSRDLFPSVGVTKVPPWWRRGYIDQSQCQSPLLRLWQEDDPAPLYFRTRYWYQFRTIRRKKLHICPTYASDQPPPQWLHRNPQPLDMDLFGRSLVIVASISYIWHKQTMNEGTYLWSKHRSIAH
jgi:hypothetical protein